LLNPNGTLVTFNGKGKYSTPEFIWKNTVGPTTLKFMSTDKFGKQYENDILVADVNNGRIYHFKLAENRTALALQGALSDKVANNNEELDNIVFAQFPGDFITDLDIGPDGYLYLLGHATGTIYKIVPNHLNSQS